MNESLDLSARILFAVGEPAARELLDVLSRSDADRAALIGRPHVREDAAWLADPPDRDRVRPRRPHSAWAVGSYGFTEGRVAWRVGVNVAAYRKDRARLPPRRLIRGHQPREITHRCRRIDPS